MLISHRGFVTLDHIGPTADLPILPSTLMPTDCTNNPSLRSSGEIPAARGERGLSMCM